MIRAIIVDDEQRSRNTLSKMLAMCCPEVEILGDVGSADEGIAMIRDKKPNLVFLDIDMPHKNGFDLLAAFGNDLPFQVIFTTAYNHYAVKAFRFSAIDYLLKPIDPDELVEAVKRAHPVPLSEQSSQIELLFEQLRKDDSPYHKIALPTPEGMHFLQLNEIIRCESDGNYTWFFLTNGNKVLVSRTLKDFEELLEGYRFCRVHQSHLINLAHIRKYIRGDGGQVVMIDDSEIEVSRRKKEDFLAQLSQVYINPKKS